MTRLGPPFDGNPVPGAPVYREPRAQRPRMPFAFWDLSLDSPGVWTFTARKGFAPDGVVRIEFHSGPEWRYARVEGGPFEAPLAVPNATLWHFARSHERCPIEAAEDVVALFEALRRRFDSLYHYNLYVNRCRPSQAR